VRLFEAHKQETHMSTTYSLNRTLIASALAMSLGYAHDALTAQADASKPAKAAAGSVDYSKSMERLQQATQKLRDAIQAMAQEPAGDRRNRAIEEAHEALFETQRAMIALPPELRVGSAGSPDYTQSMERLKAAAQKLREAAQAMAQQPAGERRAKAIDQARQALFDTQQAMIALPPNMRVAGK
jgi:hypothetical protein